ncbi:MAG: ABC transporter permease [Hamadaea sp.]|uniref:ABC transporter permease subunit n=1 Tax=Hamadaea sp. TaxID=2024425 RepID=UPI0017DF65B7|nr:ABC transporter permease subunit [Hamadaea sp.]NUR73604.1 ABC transporter permease [Hamadaea sp.]NUT22800.1 ABC transporter permease [Hamadaea sp.]
MKGSLLKAELNRLLSRRFVQILAAVMIGAFAVTVAVTMAGSTTPSAGDWAAAVSQARANNEVHQQLYDDCVAAHGPEATALDRAKYPEQCRLVVEQPEDFLYDTYVFHTSIRPLVGFLAAYLALFGFLVGATFIGAELASGGTTNLLLWRPERVRVLGAKLAVLLGSVGVFSLVFSVLYVATFYGIAKATGYVGGVDADFFRQLALLVVRGLGLALMVTGISFGIATVGRHTAAALGLLTAYAVVWEAGGRLVMEVLDYRAQEPWFLSTYVGAWMVGRLEYYFGYGEYGRIEWWHAAVVFGALVAVVLAAAFGTFRRRDLA